MLETFAQFKDGAEPYSVWFTVFWVVCVLVTAASLLGKNKRGVIRLERIAYWILAVLMVIFAVLRPYGIARDDMAYLEIYNGICASLTCGKWIQGARDWGWYSIVGLLKSFWPTPEVMLWLAGAGLLVKFGVIYRLSKHPLMAMLLFVGLFYQVLDLTAWRIALASTIFMVGLGLLIEGRTISGCLVTLSCGVFHKQALLSPVVFLGPLLQRRFMWLPLLALPPLLLILAGYSLDIPALFQKMGSDLLSKLAVEQGLDSYINIKESGGYNGWRVMPVVFYPLLALSAWLAWDVFWSSPRMYGYISAALIAACWILWMFASIPVVQVRFFEFFILPTVFLAGACRFDLWRFLGVAMVSGVFVAKYNVLHHVLITVPMP